LLGHRASDTLIGEQGLFELKVELLEFRIVGCLFFKFQIMLDGLVEHAVLDAPLSKVPMFAGTPFPNGSRLVLVE